MEILGFLCAWVCVLLRFVCISVLSVVILGLILRIRCILVYIYLSTYICILLKHSLQDRFNFVLSININTIFSDPFQTINFSNTIST